MKATSYDKNVVNPKRQRKVTRQCAQQGSAEIQLNVASTKLNPHVAA